MGAVLEWLRGAPVIPGTWEKGEEGLPWKRRPREAGHRAVGWDHHHLRLILSLGNGSLLTV